MSTLRATLAGLHTGSTVRASFTGIGSVEGVVTADIFGAPLLVADDGYDTTYRLTDLNDHPTATLTSLTVAHGGDAMSANLGQFHIAYDELVCARCAEAVADIKNESLRDAIEYAEDHWNEQHGGAS